MAKKKATPKEEKPKKGLMRFFRWRKMRNGENFSLDFIRDNGWFIVVATIIILIITGMRYRTQTLQKEIQNLNAQLRAAESEMMTEKQQYMSQIRETRMLELVRENNLGLIHQEQPPYEIEADIPVTEHSPTQPSSETK